MSKLYNLARMTTATTGTGTITLGSAVSGYLTFALAGVSNAETVSYAIKDGANSEIGTGTYTSSGTTLTRSVTKSTNSNTAISLSGTAEVFITARAEDIGNVGEANTWAAAQTLSAALNLTSGQITFPASQSASAGANTLDDYEEGTWTPALTFDTVGNLSVAYSSQFGYYTKIGRQVTVWFEIITSTFTHTTASGNLRITGLPFTIANLSINARGGSAAWQGITKANYTDICPDGVLNNTYLLLLISGSGQAAANVATGDVPTGTTKLIAGMNVHNT